MFNIWVNEAVVTIYGISIVIRLQCECETYPALASLSVESKIIIEADVHSPLPALFIKYQIF